MTSQARIVYGASAIGIETGPGTTGTVQIGIGQQAVNFADADINYCVGAQLAAIGDFVQISLDSGLATGTGATIQDGDGKDYQGETLKTLVTLYAVLVEITAGSANLQAGGIDMAPAPLQFWNPAGLTEDFLSLGYVKITATAADSEVFVTIIGKSS